MLELEHGFRVVDVHVALEPDDDRRPRDIGDPEQIEREMHHAGIVQSLAFPATREGGYVRANNAVARMAVDRPLIAAARINGVLDAGTGPTAQVRNLARTHSPRSRAEHHTSPVDVEQYAYEGRFFAFVLNPVVDGLPDHDVLAQLEEMELPVITYGGRGFPPSAIENTLLQYDIRLIVSHCGGYPLEEPLMNEMIDLLDRHEDCYVDTSFVRLRDPLERAIMEHPDRVIFGSGAPAAHPDVAVMEILTLSVPEDNMRRVFSKNVARVIEELGP